MNNNPFGSALTQLNIAAKAMNLDQKILKQLSEPQRIIQVNLPLVKDNGELEIIQGYRVQFNNWLGPYKGGLRFHPLVNMDEVKALSFWMMIKNAVVNVPFGGGKGGLTVDPKTLSVNELEQLTRQFAKALTPNIGPEVDVPAPDVNTNGQIMQWIAEEYEKQVQSLKCKVQSENSKNYSKAVVTGKPVGKGGSEGREEATGLGGFYVLEEAVSKLGLKKPLTVAVQGFGNVGAHLAQLLYKNGYLVVILADSKGGIYDDKGLDVAKVKAHKASGKRISEFKGKVISNEELLELPVDILIPAALENVITKDNAGNIKAKVVLEMANGPTSAEADKLLNQKSIIVVPDVLANAGGVTVSYFEWYQNMNSESWKLKEVEDKLKDYMVKAFNKVWHIHEDKKVNLRTSAYILALKRLISKIPT